jgi:hypothetical protein
MTSENWIQVCKGDQKAFEKFFSAGFDHIYHFNSRFYTSAVFAEALSLVVLNEISINRFRFKTVEEVKLFLLRASNKLSITELMRQAALQSLLIDEISGNLNSNQRLELLDSCSRRHTPGVISAVMDIPRFRVISHLDWALNQAEKMIANDTADLRRWEEVMEFVEKAEANVTSL